MWALFWELEPIAGELRLRGSSRIHAPPSSGLACACVACFHVERLNYSACPVSISWWRSGFLPGRFTLIVRHEVSWFGVLNDRSVDPLMRPIQLIFDEIRDWCLKYGTSIHADLLLDCVRIKINRWHFREWQCHRLGPSRVRFGKLANASCVNQFSGGVEWLSGENWNCRAEWRGPLSFGCIAVSCLSEESDVLVEALEAWLMTDMITVDRLESEATCLLRPKVFLQLNQQNGRIVWLHSKINSTE